MIGTFPGEDVIRPLIELAMAEDLGPGKVDVTSLAMIRADRLAVGTLVQKGVGVVAGLPIVEMVCRAYDQKLVVEQIPGFHAEYLEGRFSEARVQPLVRVRGPARALLAAERVMLNFLQHMGGIATLTHRFVKRTEGTQAKIYDTRKTLPGYRALAKYAVRAGGGHNHRIGLYDGLLVKDNHLAGVSVSDMAGVLNRVIREVKREHPQCVMEVEVDTLEQLAEVIRVEGVQIALLDNMDCPAMEQAVAMVRAAGRHQGTNRLELEASGGVTLETVRQIALTGVQRISVGALTHSAPALDIGLDIEML